MLLKFLGKYRDTGLLILRLGLGALFMMHGLPKLTGGPKIWAKYGAAMSHLGVDVFPIFWGFMAAVTEGIGGLLLIIGLFYRPVCLMLCFTMIVATLSLKGNNFMDRTSRPLELAFVFIGLATVGPGRFSIDKD